MIRLTHDLDHRSFNSTQLILSQSHDGLPEFHLTSTIRRDVFHVLQ
jgi:hypothetical protein